MRIRQPVLFQYKFQEKNGGYPLCIQRIERNKLSFHLSFRPLTCIIEQIVVVISLYECAVGYL